MTTSSTPEHTPAPSPVETSYDLPRILRVSGNASLLSWLFTLLGVLGLALGLYGLYNTFSDWRPYDSLAELAVISLMVSFLLLVCFGSSVLMRAVSEAILILRDIEENARRDE